MEEIDIASLVKRIPIFQRLRDNNLLIEQQLFILEDLTGDNFRS